MTDKSIEPNWESFFPKHSPKLKERPAAPVRLPHPMLPGLFDLKPMETITPHPELGYTNLELREEALAALANADRTVKENPSHFKKW